MLNPAQGPSERPRAGIDIGGTFTDVALESDGRMFTAKILTDYAAPERAILKVLQEVVAQAGAAIADIGTIIHGTTLATNALIQRSGARTAFVTTAGFRDVIEMRTESRFEQYDLNITLPPPLIERCDRYTLNERIDAAGRVLLAVDDAEMAEVASAIAAGSYDSVAIGFMHSYVNGIHETRMRDALQQRLPQLSISISSEVAPQMREYERFNTVCANAYVKPVMKSYLDRLVASLQAAGATCPLLMMHSGGGIVSAATAAEFPVRLVESGPAGGAIFAADIARRYRLDAALSFDMGGTTAKICLIEAFEPKTARTFEVARTYRFRKGSGMPISVPVVEMVEIGAGGGSLAGVDVMRQIRVGPQSAGSEPGPACYQRGGSGATVTDADLLLGRLDPGYFAGGSIVLSPRRAAEALDAAVAVPLALDTETAAYGVSEVVDENMANAGRVHAVENGRDISQYTMITFGGAGPVHAARLCEKLGIDRMLVPPGAGVGSAIGFLRAPFGFEAARSAYMHLARFDADAVNRLLEALTREAEAFMRAGAGNLEPLLEQTAYMRYAGQGWEIPVDVEPGHRFGDDGARLLKERFESAYARFFGRAIDGLDAEIVSWSVRASSPRPPAIPVEETPPLTHPAGDGLRQLFDPATRRFEQAAVFERARLPVGACVEGPAIVTERETSTVLGAGFQAVVQSDGCLLISRRAGSGVYSGVHSGVHSGGHSAAGPKP
jgi:N-methylhydantoinase A